MDLETQRGRANQGFCSGKLSIYSSGPLLIYLVISRSQKHVRTTIEKTTFFRYLLQAIGVFAVSMAIADGVLTPAQSVLGAVQGLNEINRNISKSTIIGVTCTILVLLFLAQPFGINRVSKAFSPIVIVWLALNSAFGMYNLAR